MQARLVTTVVLVGFWFPCDALAPLMRKAGESTAAVSLLQQHTAVEESMEARRAEEAIEKAEQATMSSLMMKVHSYMMMARLSQEDLLEVAEMLPMKTNHKAGQKKTLPPLHRWPQNKTRPHGHDRVSHEREAVLSLLEWLSVRICSRECNCTFTRASDCPSKIYPCRDKCKERIQRLHQASALVQPHHEEYIEFPVISPLQVPSPPKPVAPEMVQQNARDQKRTRRSRPQRQRTTTSPPSTTLTPTPTETLPLIPPGSELERLTLKQLSVANSSELRLRLSNDRTRYNGMLFAGGVTVNGSASFVARLCTYNCKVGELYYDSTIILGELYQKSSRATNGDANWSWTQAREHWIEHIDEGKYVGPEDPRMDVLNGMRFLTVTMNFDGKSVGCYTADKAFQYRHMHFIPVDPIPDAKPCRINVGEINQCMIQKNWASLVPRGSKQVLYIYSVRPLQVMYFNHSSCDAQWTQKISDVPKHPVFGGVSFDPQYSVHGGTRYIFGIEVDAGDLYWSVGHTPSPDYLPVIIAILIQKDQPVEIPPRVELVGVSCPVNLSKNYGGSSKVKNATTDWLDRMFITTSIVNFDQKADLARLTFQVQDKDNFNGEVHGIGSWLRAVYQEYASSNLVFSCDMLH